MYSIVIPTFNAGGGFPRVLSAVRSQTTTPDRLVIIDSGSTDQTVDVAHEYGATLLTISPGTFNHGRTRNLGIEATTSPYVILMTQDALPASPYAFESMLQSMEKHKAAGCYARQIPRPDATSLTKRNLEHWLSGTAERRVIRFDSPQCLWDQHPAMRYQSCVFDNVTSMLQRSVWETIPFPETPFGEDIEWAFRALCAGHTIVYEPDAEVIHSHDRDSRYVYKRTYIDHYRMYELFRLRTIPSRWHALKAWVSSSWGDIRFLLSHGGTPGQFASIPRDTWAEVWGQHDGARDAACGLAPRPTREV